MASSKITLKILEKTYLTGTPYYRMTGRVYGKTYQKNFPTRDEAEGFMSGLINSATQGKNAAQGKPAPARRVTSTVLSDLELHAAEIAFQRLKEAMPQASITSAVDFYLEHKSVLITHVSAETALKNFAERRKGRGNEENTTDTNDTVFRKFFRQQCVRTTADITRAKVENFVLDQSVEPRTRRDRHDLLHNLFEFLVREKHMRSNLVDEIDRPIVKRTGAPTIFTLDQCQALLDAAATEPGDWNNPVNGAMLPYFATAMLSGMRPDEIQRLRPDWSNFRFPDPEADKARAAEGEKVKPVISGFQAKTGEPRWVEMHDQLPGLLLKCKEAGLVPGYFAKDVFERIQQRAGVRIVVPHPSDSTKTKVQSLWDNDILRHCYASYHYPVHVDIGFLILNMGNSERVLKRSYINPNVLKADGRAFFQLVPKDLTQLGKPTTRRVRKRRAVQPPPSLVPGPNGSEHPIAQTSAVTAEGTVQQSAKT